VGAGGHDLGVAVRNAEPELFYPRTLPELAALRTVVRQLEVDLVATARAQGFSWREIGDALGITRQSAHERFARAVRR
jgi:hypothetical protein